MEKNQQQFIDNNSAIQQIPVQPQKSSKKVFLNILLLLAVAGVGIWFIFKFSNDFSDSGDMKGFEQAFSEMNIWLFLLAIGLILVYILTDGLKYYVISKAVSKKAKLRTSCKAALLGKFYDNITPSSTGGQPMQILYYIKKGYPVGEATAIAVTRFFVQMFAWSIVGCVLMIAGMPVLAYIPNEGMRNTLSIMSWIGLALVVSLPLMTLAFVLFPKITHKIVTFFVKIGAKLHIVKDKEKTLEKSRKSVSDFVNGVKIMCKSPFRFAELIVLCLLEPIITIALPYFLLIAFNNEPFSFEKLFIVSALYIYAHNCAAVIFTPGNGGAFELFLAAALAGVSASVSTWVIFSFRFLTFYSYIFLGIILLTYEFIRGIVRAKRAKKKAIEALFVKTPGKDCSHLSVCTMLSTYNGEKYVTQLLDTLVGQEGIKNIIVARDDGSKDNTPNILREYEKEGKIQKLMVEPNVGFVRSFHKLMQNAIPADYYAYSDQDDLWDSDKLLEGVRALEKEEDQSIPLVYWCAFRSIDKNNKMYKTHSTATPFKEGSDSFINAINSNDIRGCTCVFNKKALDMMLELEEGSYRIHDWMIQMIACEFGKEIYDPRPHISYRFHDANCFGPSKFTIKGIKRALHYVFKVELGHNRSMQAKEFYDAFKDEMINPDHKLYLEQAINYRTDKKVKKALLKRKDMFRSMPGYWRFVIRFSMRHNRY